MQSIEVIYRPLDGPLDGPLAARIAELGGREGEDELRLVIPDSPLPWALVRALRDRLVAEGRGTAWSTILARDPAVASLLFDRPAAATLDPADRERRDRLAAQVPGYLSHNSQVMEPLREAVAALLAPLVDRRRWVVIGGQRLDLHSLALLRRWLRDPGVVLTIAVDRDDLPEDPLWRSEAARVLAMIDGLAASEGASSSTVPRRADADVTADGAIGGDAHAHDDDATVMADDGLRGGAHLRDDDTIRRDAGVRDEVVVGGDAHLRDDDDPIARGFAALADADADADVDVDVVIAAIEATFRSFSFTACLRLADGLLARAPTLAGPTRRRVELLLAVAAYNRQVSSRGESREADEALAARLDRHLRGALDSEDDPLARSHLLYRLALNEGRRRGALDDALVLADAAVAEALRADAPFVEAWARNGRAYVLGRLGRWDEAIAEVEAAFARSDAPLIGGLASEQPFTRVVLAENLSALHRWSGRDDEARRWQDVCVALARACGSATLISPSWLELLAGRGELREALALAEAGLDGAVALFAANDADFYATWVGELAYRRGDLERARAAHERSLALSRGLGDDARARASALVLALIRLRGGDPAGAEHVLLDMSEGSLTEATARAELLALAGVAAARRGDPEAATATINRAIAVAVECGERDALLRVATMAGEACLALGDRHGAREATGQALALAAEAPAQPHDLLAALTCRFAAGVIDEEATRDALSIVDDALADAESWWLLDRLARACVDAGITGGLGLLRARLGERVDADPALLAALADADAVTAV